MDGLLTRDRLPDVVAEVDCLAAERGGRIDRADAEGVLRELGLRPELLDQALAEVARRDRARRSRRRVVLAAIIAASLAGGIVSYAFLRGSTHRAELSRVTTRDAHLSAGSTEGEETSTVTRDGSRDVFFTATLVGAPHGGPLAMQCTWTDPSGALARESRYETRPIDRDVWPTHCKTRLGAEAPVGTWHVTMKLEGRSIADRAFDVR